MTIERPTTEKEIREPSLSSLLSEDYRSALIGLGEMTVLITSIALGVFLGTLLISPDKFVPITTQQDYTQVRSI